MPFYLKVIKMKYVFFIFQTDEKINRKPVRANNNATLKKVLVQGFFFVYMFNKTKGYNNMWIMESLWFCFPGCLPKTLIRATVKPSPENCIIFFFGLEIELVCMLQYLHSMYIFPFVCIGNLRDPMLNNPGQNLLRRYEHK